MAMTTEELIDALAESTRPTPTVRPSLALASVALVGLLLVASLTVGALGIRSDLAASFTHRSSWLKYGATAVIVGLSMVAVRRLSVPGGSWRGVGWALAATFAAIAAWGSVDLRSLPHDQWIPCLQGDESLTCLVGIPLLSVVPMLTIGFAMKRLAPTRLDEAGALLGLAGGGIAAFAYSLHCREEAIPFLAIWYIAALAICAIAGRLAGPRLLRW